MATRKINPPARLEPRNAFERRVSDDLSGADDKITYEQLKTLSIFKDVNLDRIDLRALPGTIVLRRYAKDEDVCLQDHPGYTAYYVLTAAEIAGLKLAPVDPHAGADGNVVAVTRSVAAGSERKKEKLQDTVLMGHGELFGEMSCLYRVPRSATVRALRDCYVLEFLRNVLDKINAGPFRKRLDDIYRKRFLELHLRNLELFRNLTPAAYAELREGVKLLTLKPGELIFDEHDKPDGLYIIRSGYVKIVKNLSALLGPESVPDWPAFLAAIDAGSRQAGPRQRLCALALRSSADPGQKPSTSDAASPSALDQRDLLHALNDLLKKKDFAAQIGFDFAGPTASWASEAKELAASKKEDPGTIRRFNRRLLEALLPKLLVPYGIHPPRVLAYRSSPQWVSFSAAQTSDTDSSLIGEIGMLAGSPRSTTCIAYGQPDDRYIGVGLVHVDQALFEKLLNPANQASARSEPEVMGVATVRTEETPKRMSLPVWTQESISRQFEELGLIQGQKLMLIDLDRCTRCDQCVEACVDSHTPGWFDWMPILGNAGPRDGRSRLFLEGPRIQMDHGSQVKNYLVPSTCRQCKDPVCLIGCPVGSIHKGENGQIVIEDWCIGCSRCALNCPYDAIQMHAIGVIPRATTGWKHRQGNRRACEGATPFRHDRDFRAAYRESEPIEFAHAFDLSAEQAGKSATFMLHLVSSATDMTAEVNGDTVQLRQLAAEEAKQKGWNAEAMLSLAATKPPNLVPGDEPPQPLLRRGHNEIKVRLSLAKSRPGTTLLDVGLTGYVLPVVDRSVAGDEYKQDWLMDLAVVCDMCSGQFGQQPACVTACPHEAAERRFITYDSFLSGAMK